MLMLHHRPRLGWSDYQERGKEVGDPEITCARWQVSGRASSTGQE
jgi:hypothetical protein